MTESKYQCSSCGAEYSSEEYIELDRVQAVKDEEDPTGRGGHGYHTVCECGHEFYADEWSKITTVETDERTFRVFSLHLVVNHKFHGDDENLWYETRVEWDGGSHILERHTTQEEAEDYHDEVISAIHAGEFEVQDQQSSNFSLG